MTLTIAYETHDSIIVTGPGAEIMNALMTPAVARCWLQTAQAALRAAWSRLDRAAEEPPAKWIAEDPKFWSRAARLERWHRECAAVCRCCAAIDAAQAELDRFAARRALAAE